MNKETLQGYNSRLSINNDTITNINSLLKRLPVGGEDLTEELDTYTTELNSQEELLTIITEALAGKAAGAGSSINVFMQTNEPTTKDGIWLQSDGRYDHITFAEITSGGDWVSSTSRLQIPYTFKEGNGVQIGDAVYLFGGAGGSATAYKYDLANNVYTQLANIPVSFQYEPCTALGTNVYLSAAIGSASVGNQLWKYDTLTNSYTQLASRPQPNTGSMITAVGDDTLYSWGCDWGESYGRHGYKYTVSTNKWDEIATPPVPMAYNALCTMGDKVYIFGSSYSTSYNYRVYVYDTINNNYTQVSDSPFYVRKAIAKDDKNIYLVGNNGQGTTANPRMYIYNIELGTYTELITFSYNVDTDAAIALYGDEVVIIGNRTNTTMVLSLKPNITDILDKTVVVDWNTKTTDTYSFKLFDISKITNDFSNDYTYYFHDVLYCKSNGKLDSSIPTYYGNGTEWVKFKN